jgi:hypothetical protein
MNIFRLSYSGLWTFEYNILRVARLQGIPQVRLSIVVFFYRHLYYYFYYIYLWFILVLVLFRPPCLLHYPLWLTPASVVAELLFSLCTEPPGGAAAGSRALF